MSVLWLACILVLRTSLGVRFTLGNMIANQPRVPYKPLLHVVLLAEALHAHGLYKLGTSTAFAGEEHACIHRALSCINSLAHLAKKWQLPRRQIGKEERGRA